MQWDRLNVTRYGGFAGGNSIVAGYQTDSTS